MTKPTIVITSWHSYVVQLHCPWAPWIVVVAWPVEVAPLTSIPNIVA